MDSLSKLRPNLADFQAAVDVASENFAQAKNSFKSNLQQDLEKFCKQIEHQRQDFLNSGLTDAPTINEDGSINGNSCNDCSCFYGKSQEIVDLRLH